MHLPGPEKLNEMIYAMYRSLAWPSSHRYRTIAPLFGRPGTFDLDCDLAVDGFARSGNTFVADMLRVTQGEGFKIASHHHIPPFLMSACEAGKPTALLIREPVDSALSLSLHSAWSVTRSLDHYIAYHECLRPLQPQLLIAPFAEFTHDFPQFVRQLNRRFGLALKADFEHAAMAAMTLSQMDQRLSSRGQPLNELQIHRPTETRQRLKTELLKQLEAPAMHARLERANDLYAEFLRSRGSAAEPAARAA